MTTKQRGWSRSESRAVRPFMTADSCLSNVALRLSDDGDFDASEVISLSSLQPDRLSISIRIPAIPTAVASDVGVRNDSLRLIVVLEDTVFKRSHVLDNRLLLDAEDDDLEITFPHVTLGQFSWTGDTNLSVALVLGSENSAIAGAARRRGAWIARKVFRFVHMRDTAHFSVDSVSPEYFKKLGLPGDTPYLVEIKDDDFNQSSDALPDLLKVSISEDLSRTLSSDGDSHIARVQMKSIYVDVIVSVLVAGYSSLGAGDVLPDGILDVLTRRIAKSNAVAEPKIRAAAQRSAGAFLRPFVQSDADLLRLMVSACQRRP